MDAIIIKAISERISQLSSAEPKRIDPKLGGCQGRADRSWACKKH